MRIGGADAVDLLHLAGSERFVRIEAPDAFEQALAAQDLVAAADHAVEVVGDIEDRRVAVGHLAKSSASRSAGIGPLVDRRVNALEQLDGAS